MGIAPFSTWFTPVAGMNQGEIQAEIARLYQRQKAIDAVLHGEMDEDDFFCLLAEHEVDPDEWAATSIANVEFLTGEKI